MRRVVMIALCLLAAGCGRKQPLLAHGQPVAHWLQALQDPDPAVRRKAVVALGHVGTADPAALPAVIEAVKDRDAGVRGDAVLALMNLGPDARDAVGALEQACGDRDPRVRSYAEKALKRVRGD
jgi:HEAT repeat protein